MTKRTGERRSFLLERDNLSVELLGFTIMSGPCGGGGADFLLLMFLKTRDLVHESIFSLRVFVVCLVDLFRQFFDVSDENGDSGLLLRANADHPLKRRFVRKSSIDNEPLSSGRVDRRRSSSGCHDERCCRGRTSRR